MKDVRRNMGAALVLSSAIVFMAMTVDVMTSEAKASAGEGPQSARLQDLPAPLQAQLRHAAMQDNAAGLHLTEDGASYVYTCPSFHAARGESAPYMASLACDPSRGVEVTAGKSEYSVKLIPMVPALTEIRRTGEGLAYSTPDGSVQLVYTFKRNGLKEDIVLSGLPVSDWTISFQMQLDPMVEARQDAKGNILVYGPDSVLSGFVQTGDDASAQLVMKARRMAPKTNLLYIIPAPVVTDGEGRLREGASYMLKPGLLELHLRGAEGWPAPLTIDPSIVVSTTADFGAGNNEGMISFDTDAISRAAPSGGLVGEWDAATSLPTARYGHASVAYNGYLYATGGYTGSYLNEVGYAPIQSDGTLGAWSATTNFPTARSGHTSVAYNGFLYVLGGSPGGFSLLNDVQVAAIHSDGTVGAWSATTSFATARSGHATVVYNGYLYVIGGAPFSGYLNDVQVAPFHADGTVGAWRAVTAFATARTGLASVAYNGYLYVIGGTVGNGVYANDVQFALLHEDGTVGAWGVTTTFTTARTNHTSVACNGYLYVLGGYNGGYLNDVQCAPILASGQLGHWAAAPSFDTARQRHTSVAYNGYLYVIGGSTGVSSYLNSIQMAPIVSGVTDWNWNATTSFSTERAMHTSVAYNGYLYVAGGINIGTRLNDVQYAPINDDGTIGAWSATTSFPTARAGHTSVACNGYLYVIGGLSSGGGLSQITVAPINPDGTVGTWFPTTNFPTARWTHASVVYNGYLYVIGGTGGAGVYLNDVQFAPINSNGTVGSWSATTSFSTGRYGHTSTVYGGYLYVIGGMTGASTFLDDIQAAPVNANGTVGTWSATTNLPAVRAGHSSVACNGYLFVIGGSESLGSRFNDVQYAPISSDGTVGDWSTATNGFATVRAYHASAVANGYLYVIGGSRGTSDLNDVQVALIGARGTLGAWSATTGFATGRRYHASVAYNGYLYVICGWSQTAWLKDVQYATINPDGTMGSWSATTSLSLARYLHASVAYKGYLYVIGGANSFKLDDVQVAPINANGTIGAWSATTSLAAGRLGHSAVAYDGYLYVVGGATGNIYCNDVMIAPINSDGTVGAWSATASFSTSRWLHTSVVYNGYLYVIGGDTGTPGSELNDVQVAPIHSDGTIGTWSATTSFTTGRYGHTSVACDGYLYVLCGNNNFSNFEDVQYAPIHSNGTVGAWESTASLPAARTGPGSAAGYGYLFVTGGLVEGSGYMHDIQVAPMNTPAPRAAYSKLLDIGSDQVVESLQFDSTTGRAGVVNVTYSVAPQSTAVFGTRTTLPDASPGTPYPSVLGCGRWIWIRADLDDGNSATIDSAGTMGRRDILDFIVTYDSQAGIGDTLDAVKTTRVHLTWEAAPGATTYRVNRCDATAGHCTPSLLGTTSNLYYDDNVLGNSAQYWYSVQAVNGACVSP